MAASSRGERMRAGGLLHCIAGRMLFLAFPRGESNKLVTKLGPVPNLLLRISTETQHQAQDFGRIAPAKAVAFDADRKAIFDSALTAEKMSNNMISLAAPVKLPSAEMTGSGRFLLDIIPLFPCQRASRFPRRWSLHFRKDPSNIHFLHR
jgi:hypothetical protein